MSARDDENIGARSDLSRCNREHRDTPTREERDYSAVLIRAIVESLSFGVSDQLINFN